MNVGGYFIPQNFPFMFPFNNFFRPNRGRGPNNGLRGQAPIGNRYLYQLCGKVDHLISRCWYQFDQNYQPFNNQPNSLLSYNNSLPPNTQQFNRSFSQNQSNPNALN